MMEALVKTGHFSLIPFERFSCFLSGAPKNTHEYFRVDLNLLILRDTDRREVDFVVLRDGVPEFAVECKHSDRPLDKSIPYFL